MDREELELDDSSLERPDNKPPTIKAATAGVLDLLGEGEIITRQTLQQACQIGVIPNPKWFWEKVGKPQLSDDGSLPPIDYSVLNEKLGLEEAEGTRRGVHPTTNDADQFVGVRQPHNQGGDGWALNRRTVAIRRRRGKGGKE